ncbi:DUF2235 domain-containing protein [Microcystis aeruginosa CS-1036]|uniref:phospholipase effector Tle1 domain-containing protein n=1 Tax=Microcystis aeruginosa TaxID=1126 RepID=UPI00232CF1FD|nr:DUF2235 domain-containing protein [Microcystis aeruginosa]MDB9545621.1 DUF2235 domain-containing protein [Microcystis aeruginosa CS-1036]
MSQTENTTSVKKDAIESVLAFDGIDDYVQLPAANTDYSQGFTVEAWVQHKSFRSWSRIIDFGNGAEKNSIVLGNVGKSKPLGLHLFCNNEKHFIEAPNALEIGKWTHVAATIDKSGMGKLYKNGQLIQSKQLSLPDNLNRTLNYIGKSNWVNDGYFEGQMTEVRVWNIARPESEIKENMSQRLKGNETVLVGYLPLNEGSENIAKDKTSNGNNGTINGATWGKSELPITGTKESEIGKKPDVITGGNSPSKYGIADTRTNYYLVDTNKPINGNGEITGWNIWAENTSPVQLITYRKEANTWSVVGKSEVKTPVIGLNEFSLTTPIKVNQGDFVGIYYPQAGSISYDKNTAPLGNLSGKVLFTSSGATATAFSDSVDRIYSLSVKGNVGEIPIKIEKTETANYGVIGVGTNNLLCSRDTLTSDWKEIPNSGAVIGAIVMPDGKIVGPETLTPSELSNPQTPSNNEEVTPKEQSSSIKPEILTPSETSNPQTSESTQDKNMSEPLSKPDTTEPTKPSNTTKKKRLVVCCDGTWNELATSYPTNVVKFARLVKYTADDQTPQMVHYISGCGTEEDADLIERLGGGAFGWGIDRIIQDAYRFLCMNYDVEAEDEIYLVGFSRGAYTVRCLAGMIYNSGLLSRSKIRELPKAYELYRNSKIKPNDPEAQKFREDNSKKIDSEKDYLQGRVPIKMLGCWDTVGALGVPDLTPWLPLAKLWNRKYEFFDARLSPIVENAFHAVAIDEKRRGFPSSAMQRSDKNPEQVVKEVFFAGEHGCIGGGTKEYRGLSDYTLQWMIHEAKKLGLEFDSTENYSEEFQIKPEPTTKFDNSVTGVYALAGEGWRPIESLKVAVHYSVVERLKADPNYRPQNLTPLLNKLLP